VTNVIADFAAVKNKKPTWETPGGVSHVGLLMNEPPGGLNQTSRVALYVVIRRLYFISRAERRSNALRFNSHSDVIKRGSEYKCQFFFSVLEMRLILQPTRVGLGMIGWFRTPGNPP